MEALLLALGALATVCAVHAGAGSSSCQTTPGNLFPGPEYHQWAPVKQGVVCERQPGNTAHEYRLVMDESNCGSSFCVGARSKLDRTRVFLQGTVRDTNCRPLVNATLDIWQPDAFGNCARLAIFSLSLSSC